MACAERPLAEWSLAGVENFSSGHYTDGQPVETLEGKQGTQLMTVMGLVGLENASI